MDKKEVIFWKFDLNSLKDFYHRVETLKKLGIPDSRDMRMMILHTMAHQGVLQRDYINGNIREELEQEIREWARKNLKKGEQQSVSSRNAEDSSRSGVGGFFRKLGRMVKVLFMGNT